MPLNASTCNQSLHLPVRHRKGYTKSTNPMHLIDLSDFKSEQ